jgi:hypothetical protein
VVAAVNPPAASAGRTLQTAAPPVRLATPASVGRGLRDDDVTGVYLALAGLAVLMTVGAFALRGGRRAARAATAGGSVLKLPAP